MKGTQRPHMPNEDFLGTSEVKESSKKKTCTYLLSLLVSARFTKIHGTKKHRSVFLLHRLTTCTTPQNTPWVFSAILVSAKFYRTLPAMKCYEIPTCPFLADCICIMFEDHLIFYVLPKDLSVETPHFCQALHGALCSKRTIKGGSQGPSQLLS